MKMIVFIMIFVCIISIMLGFVLGYKRCNQYSKRRIKELEQVSYNAQIRARNWQCLLFSYKRKGRISTFLDINNMEKIAIYGYGLIGKYVEEELRLEGINVSFAVDKNTKIAGTLPVYVPTDQLPEYDVMIVTSGNAEEIRDLVGGTVNTVIELEAVLNVI